MRIPADHVGIIPRLDERLYHAHPALSSTQARELLDSPARYAFNRTVPRADTKSFDVGTAAHSKVLGVGAGIAVYPDGAGDHVFTDPDTGEEHVNVLASNGAASTAIAKRFEKATREAGLIPVKRVDAVAVDHMAESILSHPKARLVLEQTGIPEASVFATDPDTGVQVRCRFDYLGTGDGRRVAGDVKTTAKRATKAAFAKAVADLGYHVQDAHYDDTLRFAGGSIDAFLFIVVEKEPPYLTAVFMLDRDFKEIGHQKAARARRVLATCREKDEWPGYSADIALLRPPMYAVFDYQDQTEEGLYA